MSGTADPMQVEESTSSVETEVMRLLGESYERVKLLLKKVCHLRSSSYAYRKLFPIY